jgi:hypothetical protein
LPIIISSSPHLTTASTLEPLCKAQEQFFRSPQYTEHAAKTWFVAKPFVQVWTTCLCAQALISTTIILSIFAIPHKIIEEDKQAFAMAGESDRLINIAQTMRKRSAERKKPEIVSALKSG